MRSASLQKLVALFKMMIFLASPSGFHVFSLEGKVHDHPGPPLIYTPEI